MKHPTLPDTTVSRETRDRLDAFATLLLRWNRTINLVSRRDEASLWPRHIQDSLNLLPYLPTGFSHAIDLGSGGGFPGIVLAIATDRHFDLVESDHRKATFLREAARITRARATIHTDRAETIALPPAPLITARAAAPLPTLLKWSTRLLLPSGVCVFPKGRSVEDELTLAAREWHMQIEQWPNPMDASARILRLSEIRRV